MKHKIIYASILFFMQMLNAIGQNAITTNLPPNFAKMASYKEMNAALDIVMDLKPNATPEYVSNLVYQIKQNDVLDGAKAYSIFLLGELRTTNTTAIEILIEKIDLKAPRQLALRLPLWGKYPAEEALAKIGKPVVNPILTYLPNETNQLRRQLMCVVLKQVWRYQ